MRRVLFCIVLATWLLAAAGCGRQVIRTPIDPYVASDLSTRQIKRVAVLPIIVPDYLRGKGGEAVSVDLTNQLMADLAGDRLFDVVGGTVVTDALAEQYGRLQDWVFDGNIVGAVKIGRELKADGVVFGRVTRYIQSNLDQSEFEIRVELVEIASMETVWSIHELLIGKGAAPGYGEAVTTPSARELSNKGVRGAAERIGEVYEAGGPIEVSNISGRKIWGYSLLTAGAVTSVAAGYYLALSAQAYQKYQDADSAADLSQYQDDAEEYDQMWMILAPIGLGLLGGGTYLLLTDPARNYTTIETDNTRLTFAPTVTTGGVGLTCLGQF
ncbi:MAG: hypothetical protein P9L99_01280 [Candidatus Lernaella stagnicola]|nr:hypothetical protein [Candidatus Lernaella stagnicola]